MTNTPVNKKGTGSSKENGYGGGGGGGGDSSIEVMRCRNARSNAVYLSFMYCVCRTTSFLCLFFFLLVCILLSLEGKSW